MTTPKFTISSKDKELITSILSKADDDTNEKVRILDFNSLYKLLTKDERYLAKKFLNINPHEYGFKGSKLGIQDVPKNLVMIRSQKYKFNDKVEKIETQYLPKPVYLAYERLNKALSKDTKKKLLVVSGYRSPAYQLVVFLWHLKNNEFNFLKTIKISALPGYSEHGHPETQAIDFLTADGIPENGNPQEFANTIEYKWLVANAAKFGFHLSYPRDNKLGIVFEPWHWKYIEQL